VAQNTSPVDLIHKACLCTGSNDVMCFIRNILLSLSVSTMDRPESIVLAPKHALPAGAPAASVVGAPLGCTAYSHWYVRFPLPLRKIARQSGSLRMPAHRAPRIVFPGMTKCLWAPPRPRWTGSRVVPNMPRQPTTQLNVCKRLNLHSSTPPACGSISL
jgi:hypothetical protein